MGIERESQNAFGTNPFIWESGLAKTITFIVTEDCQLRCKYCYISGKNEHNKMPFEIARGAVDYILEHPKLFSERSVIWEFIGGEPFLEIDLIDRICDYFKMRMYELNHPWFNNYRISISTNGLNYHKEKVQNFIKKNITHLSIGFSLDGTEEKHDLQRVYLNGKGSYSDVVKNIPLWMEQFPFSGTKATVSHDDLPYIKESVLHLWKLGIKNVFMNLVFENCWKDGDDIILETQLRLLSDEILKNGYYKNFYCSLFSESIGNYLDPSIDNQNWCGAGKILAIDYSGNFYPCVRFVSYSLNKRKEKIIGNIFSGLDRNLLRPYIALSRTSQSSDECINCEVASGCAWCQGLNYDEADTDTIYQRATFICKMHQARVRANKYLWENLQNR